MPWDSFLMKKLLKSGICGSMNSTRMHCSQKTQLNVAAESKKKKKKRQNAKEETHRSFQHNSNGYIMFALLRNFLHRANTQLLLERDLFIAGGLLLLRFQALCYSLRSLIYVRISSFNFKRFLCEAIYETFVYA